MANAIGKPHGTIGTVRKMIRDEISDPEELATLLELVAQDCYESGSELTSSWQDPNAEMPWNKAGEALDGAARVIRHNLP